LNRREKKTNQDTDDRDNDQQLDKGKTLTFRHSSTFQNYDRKIKNASTAPAQKNTNSRVSNGRGRLEATKRPKILDAFASRRFYSSFILPIYFNYRKRFATPNPFFKKKNLFHRNIFAKPENLNLQIR
jgi:hypothetical protein